MGGRGAGTVTRRYGARVRRAGVKLIGAALAVPVMASVAVASVGCDEVNAGFADAQVVGGFTGEFGVFVPFGAFDAGDRITFSVGGDPADPFADGQPKDVTISVQGAQVCTGAGGCDGASHGFAAPTADGLNLLSYVNNSGNNALAVVRVTATCMPAPDGGGGDTGGGDTGGGDTGGGDTGGDAGPVFDGRGLAREIDLAMTTLDALRLPVRADALPGACGAGGSLAPGLADRRARLSTQGDSVPAGVEPPRAGDTAYLEGLKARRAELQARLDAIVNDEIETRDIQSAAIQFETDRLVGELTRLGLSRDLAFRLFLAVDPEGDLVTARASESERRQARQAVLYDTILAHSGRRFVADGDGGVRQETDAEREARARAAAYDEDDPRLDEILAIMAEIAAFRSRIAGNNAVGASAFGLSKREALAAEIEKLDDEIASYEYYERGDYLDDAEDLCLNEGEHILFAPAAGGQGLSFAMSTDALHRMAANAAGETATADALSMLGMPANLWMRGRATALDGNRTGLDGWSGEVLFGLAVAPSLRSSVGFWGSLFRGEIDSNVSGTEMDVDLGGFGLYGRRALGRGLFLGGSAGFETGEVTTRDATGARGTADLRRARLSASLVGLRRLGEVTLSPRLSGDMVIEDRDGYTDSLGRFVPGSSRTEGQVSAGLQASRGYRLSGQVATAVRTTLGGALTYAVRERDSVTVSTGQVISPDDLSASVSGGVLWQLRGGGTLRLDAAVGGIGQDTQGYSGQVALTIPLAR